MLRNFCRQRAGALLNTVRGVLEAEVGLGIFKPGKAAVDEGFVQVEDKGGFLDLLGRQNEVCLGRLESLEVMILIQISHLLDTEGL